MFDETNENKDTTPGLPEEPVNPYLTEENTPVSPIPEEPKKSNSSVKIVIGVVIAVVIILAAALALVLSGVLKDKKQVVAEALKATWEESADYVGGVWDMEQYEGMFADGVYTMEAEFDLQEGLGADITVQKNEDAFGMYADVAMAGSTAVEVEAYMDDAQILFMLPNMLDYVFTIDRETFADDIQNMIDIGMLDEETAEQLIQMNEGGEKDELSEEAVKELSEEIAAAWKTFYEKGKMEKADSKKVVVNGEERDGEGYTFIASYEDTAMLFTAVKDAYQNNEEVYKLLETSLSSGYGYDIEDLFDELQDSIDEMTEETEEGQAYGISFYLYDGKVAQIYLEDEEEEDNYIQINIEGGNFPLENVSIVVSDELDGEVEIRREGSDSDGEYRVKYIIEDEYDSKIVMDTRYTKESGEISFELLEDDYSLIFLSGSMEKADASTIAFGIDALEVEEEMILSGDITIQNQCDEIEVPEGEEMSLFLMDEEDWQMILWEVAMSMY